MLKQQREVERVQRGLKSKGAESAKRMLRMLTDSQSGTLKKAAYAAWHDHVLELNQQMALERVEEGLRAKSAESSKRMLGMLMGSQAAVLTKAALTGWQDLAVQAR